MLCLDPASNNRLLSSTGMNCIYSSLISSLTWIYTLGTSRVKKDEKCVSYKTHLSGMGRSSNFYISCTFAYKTSQLHLKSHASSSQRKSSRTANLILHLGHFTVVMSEPTLSIFHSARLRPIIWSPLPSVARSSSSMGKRAEIPYK